MPALDAKKCMYFSNPGGMGVPVGQPLIRFIGNLEELTHLLSGGLSFKKTCEFRDALEAEPTRADIEKKRQWFAGSEHMYDEFLAHIRDIRCETFVSCWHQLTDGSDLARLYDEYACVGGVELPFWCIVKTTERLASQTLGSHTPFDLWAAHLDRVRYLKDENQTLEQFELNGSKPMWSFPTLFYKRKEKYEWENEARFVLHESSAVTSYPGTRRKQGLLPFPDKYAYAAVNSEIFVEEIFFNSEACFAEAKGKFPDIDRRFKVMVRAFPDTAQILKSTAPPRLIFGE
jgi:hypothetical protein